MRSSKADDPDGWGLDELNLLAELGFGPDSSLMSEPKLFIDGPFLAALQGELVDEVGASEARMLLFQIGVIHGLRDARRISASDPASVVAAPIACPPLLMHLGSRSKTAQAFEVPGSWPERYEAEAHLSRLGRAADPSCMLSAGYTSGWLSGTFERDILAVECTCRAAGDEECTFLARETESWAVAGDPRADALLERIPIASLRLAASGSDLIAEDEDELPSDPLALLDDGDAAVHIWGPVMVMPFTDVDGAIQTVEMLGRDPAMSGIRVVVLDLRQATIDEGFGAAGLERLIAHVQTWGAEMILTGISPASDRIVSELQISYLLSRKDLPDAIAYAFQVAEAQRHIL